MKKPRMSEAEKLEIFKNIARLMYDGVCRGTAIARTAKELDRPYTTIRYHFDKWVKEGLKEYLAYDA